MLVVTLSVSTSRTATLASSDVGAALESSGPERRGLEAAETGTAAVVAIELVRNFRLFMQDHLFSWHPRDEICGEPAKSIISQNVRSLLFRDLSEALNSPLGGCNQKCVKPPRQHLSDFLLFKFGILFRRGDH